MKKVNIIWLFAFATMFFCSVSHGVDRYEHIGRTLDGGDSYIDIQSIAYTNNPNIFRFWTITVESDLSRENSMNRVVSELNKKDLMSYTNLQELKNIYQKLSRTNNYIEIDFQHNTYQIIETIFYDAEGHLLDRYTSTSTLSNISPNSFIERIRDVVYRIIRNNTYRTPQQPFVTPQPQPQQRIPQPQLPLNNQQQREEYSKLLEYISWLIAQPDYPEFDRWVSQKMGQAGVTPTQVNAGIEEYVRLSGGKYSDIRAMLASWYREFYMDKYGKH